MNKNFVILGAGESGVGTALLAKQKGYNVFISDGGTIKEKYKTELLQHEIEFEEGHHTIEKILQADEVMKSPGISEKNEAVKAIRAKGISIISEFELAYRYKGESKIAAITGTNGKSTCTSLLYHICSQAGLDCALVGNIGVSIARQIATAPKALYVAEISSFQLDDIVHFRPDYGILLNITEDHLDRYEYKMENYIKSKFNIRLNQTKDDYFIYCADDPVTTQYLNNYPFHSTPLPFSMSKEFSKGGFIKNREMIIKTDDNYVTISIDDIPIKGKHNQYNTLAAGVSAASMGIRSERIRESVETFQGLEHRMEPVATIRGVEFINDSKSTNVNGTWFALESMEKPVILILGGMDKGNDYSSMIELVKEKVKAIVCLGVDNNKINEVFGNIVPLMVNTNNMEDAVKSAFHFSNKGDVVLLSPACASFDLFQNFEDRGRQFKMAVRDL